MYCRSVYFAFVLFVLIHRPVALADTPRMAGLTPFATADSLRVEWGIAGQEILTGQQVEGKIVHARTGQTLWSGSLSPAGSHTISGLKPDHWAPNHPALYNLTVTLLNNGQPVTN